MELEIRDLLDQYIDACEVIKETEREIKRVKKRREVVQDSVTGSMNDFPYAPTKYHIEGTREHPEDARWLQVEEHLLVEQKQAVEEIRRKVDSWMPRIPARMQRIIRYKIFESLTWEEVAERMGRNATGDSVRMEFKRFFEKI